ncbi:MAG: serine protease [Thiohalomonas sp.]|nr:serine protease [Thiohalomonas sp.]
MNTANAFQARIIGGIKVHIDKEKWKFIASMKWDNNHYCGASLISERWVLTAAHCWFNTNSEPYEILAEDRIALGSYNLNLQTDYKIKSLVIHPDYDHDTFDSDLAIFELKTPVDGIQPAILDRSTPLEGGLESWVAGWGITGHETVQDDLPVDLIEVMVPIMSKEACDDIYGTSITSSMFCAGYVDTRRDACYGDSGGPLIIYKNGHWVQLAVVSWGTRCGETGYAGVYTHLQKFIPWIETYTGALASFTDTNITPIISTYLLN